MSSMSHRIVHHSVPFPPRYSTSPTLQPYSCSFLNQLYTPLRLPITLRHPFPLFYLPLCPLVTFPSRSHELETCDWPRNVDCAPGATGGGVPTIIVTDPRTQSTRPVSTATEALTPSVGYVVSLPLFDWLGLVCCLRLLFLYVYLFGCLDFCLFLSISASISIAFMIHFPFPLSFLTSSAMPSLLHTFTPSSLPSPESQASI